MKPLFYYFGVRRGNKIFCLREPVSFRGSWIENLSSDRIKKLMKNKGINIESFVEELLDVGNSLVGVGGDNKKVTELLKYGKLITPSISSKIWNVFFLDEEKLIVFRSVKSVDTLIIGRTNIQDIVTKLEIMNKQNILKEMKLWKEALKADGCCERNWVIRGKGTEVMIGDFERLLVVVKTSDYEKIKATAKEKFKSAAPSGKVFRPPKTR